MSDEIEIDVSRLGQAQKVDGEFQHFIVVGRTSMNHQWTTLGCYLKKDEAIAQCVANRITNATTYEAVRYMSVMLPLNCKDETNA